MCLLIFSIFLSQQIISHSLPFVRLSKNKTETHKTNLTNSTNDIHFVCLFVSCVIFFFPFYYHVEYEQCLRSIDGIDVVESREKFTRKIGSRRPSLASVHSTNSSIKSYSAARFEKELQQKELRQEMKLRLTRLQQHQQLIQNKPHIVITDPHVIGGAIPKTIALKTPSPLTPNSLDELLPCVIETAEVSRYIECIFLSFFFFKWNKWVLHMWLTYAIYEKVTSAVFTSWPIKNTYTLYFVNWLTEMKVLQNCHYVSIFIFHQIATDASQITPFRSLCRSVQIIT